MHILAAHIADRHAVDGNAAAVELEEAHQQIDHRGLAGTGRADDGDLLAWLHLGGEILDDDLVRRVRIAEADVVEADVATHSGKRLRLFALVGQFLAL